MKNKKRKNYKQSPRNGKVKIIKRAKQSYKLPDPYKHEFADAMQHLRQINREEY